MFPGSNDPFNGNDSFGGDTGPEGGWSVNPFETNEYLDFDAFAAPKKKVRPNKFLAVGLHFFEQINACSGE